VKPAPRTDRSPALEPLERAEFARRLAAAGAVALPEPAVAALHAHYGELARWAGVVDLVGPGAAAELFERHYGEALAALPLLPPGPFRLLDVGSGAGFPGLVLAAARPEAEVWLAEPRERRAAFLAVAARKMGLGSRILGARVDGRTLPELPDRLDVVTLRALRLAPRAYRQLVGRGTSDLRFLLWSGGETPPLPPELRIVRELPLPRSERRRLLELRPVGAAP
jgi:16S rRNA (guanine527-N7)-methyltransferase